MFLAVKPQVLPALLSEMSEPICKKQPLVISIAAGITEATIQNSIKNNQIAIIRVMPNTPALVKTGASGMFANAFVSSAQKEIAKTLMGAVGLALWVDNESDIDSVTALSGSGPAYFMRFINALIHSAEKAGLPKGDAKLLALQTCIGSAKLIQVSSNTSIEQLIDNVTSPGGTTEQALLSFSQNNLEDIIDDAFQAALIRSQQLGESS